MFIAPPSVDTLEERLRSRGTETEESIKKRTNTAIEELRESQKRSYFDSTLVNDELEACFSEFKQFLDGKYDQFKF